MVQQFLLCLPEIRSRWFLFVSSWKISLCFKSFTTYPQEKSNHKKYPTGTPRRIDVDIRHFSTSYFYVISMYFFRCNFDGQKIHVVSTYFFQCNFDVRKIRVVSTYFFRCNFDGRKIHLASTCFFQCNFFHWNIQSFYTYFFQRNFYGLIIHFVCTYFFRRNFDEFDVVVGKL